MKSKSVICKSGIRGQQYKLQDSYNSFIEFKDFCRNYNIHKRLGYVSMKAAWESNPTIQSSVIPTDLSRVYYHVVRGKNSISIKESTERECAKLKGSACCFQSRDGALAQLNTMQLK